MCSATSGPVHAVHVKFARGTHEAREDVLSFIQFKVTFGIVTQPFTITLVPVPRTAGKVYGSDPSRQHLYTTSYIILPFCAGSSDYRVTSNKIAEFKAGSTEAWASYELLQDSLCEGNEVFTLTARVEGPGAGSVTMVYPTQLTVTIIDVCGRFKHFTCDTVSTSCTVHASACYMPPPARVLLCMP